MSKGIRVTLSDLPAWAQDIVRQHFGKDIEQLTKRTASLPVYVNVYPDGVAHIGGVGHENGTSTVYARNEEGEVMSAYSGYYESWTVNSPENKAIYQGGKVPIREGDALMKIERFMSIHTINLYVHGSGPYAGIAQRLSSGELDELQMAVVHLYCGLTTAGRKDRIWRDRIPTALVEQVTDQLVDKGLFKRSKNGAIRKSEEVQLLHSNARSEWVEWPRLVKAWRESQ